MGESLKVGDFKLGFAFIEASTGNGKYPQEWDHHYIKGRFEIVEILENKIILKEDKIKFPVMISKIKKYEPD